VTHTWQSSSTPGSGAELAGLLANLARLVRRLAGTGTRDELIEVAAEHLRAGLGCSTVSISRLEAGTGTLRTLINVGDLGPGEERWPVAETYSLQAYLKLRGIVHERAIWTLSRDDEGGDPAELNLLAQLGKHAALAAPLVVNNTMWGELYLTYVRGEDLPGPGGRAYLEVYLAIVESALTREQQVHSLEQLAYRDPLTGLANRRALDLAATGAFETLGSAAMARVTVVAFDLNGLKAVNDRFGHPEGDRLIRGAAMLVEEHFNGLAGSLPARVGGDEFVVLVPGHDVAHITSRAEATCLAIAGLEVGAGAACGIATADGTSQRMSVSELFRGADAALYRSKGSHRLVAVEASGPPESEPTGMMEHFGAWRRIS
jgi:diguanylate cyclase (GGDEF)-like protein